MKYFAIATLTLVSLFSRATDVPKKLADNVRFVRVGEATGRLSEHRFLESVTYAANAFAATSKPSPKILVIHCDDYFAEWVGIDRKIGLALFTPSDATKPGSYELWILGEGTDEKYASAATAIYRHVTGKDDIDVLPEAKQVLKELQATVDAAVLHH